MKCTALVYRELRGKKYPKWKILSILSKTYLARNVNGFLPYPKEKYEPCDGNLKVEISIENYSYCCCCSSPSIEVRYVCDKCKCGEQEVDLPTDKDSLEVFVNQALDSR